MRTPAVGGSPKAPSLRHIPSAVVVSASPWQEHRVASEPKVPSSKGIRGSWVLISWSQYLQAPALPMPSSISSVSYSSKLPLFFNDQLHQPLRKLHLLVVKGGSLTRSTKRHETSHMQLCPPMQENSPWGVSFLFIQEQGSFFLPATARSRRHAMAPFNSFPPLNSLSLLLHASCHLRFWSTFICYTPSASQQNKCSSTLEVLTAVKSHTDVDNGRPSSGRQWNDQALGRTTVGQRNSMRQNWDDTLLSAGADHGRSPTTVAQNLGIQSSYKRRCIIRKNKSMK